MKFRVDRDVLAEAVAWTARSIPTRPGTLPQLSGHHGEHRARRSVAERVRLRDVGPGHHPGRCRRRRPGPGLRPAAGRHRPRPARTSRSTSHSTAPSSSVTCGSSRFSLQTMPVEDYPALPEMPAVAGTVDGDLFAAAVGQAVTAAGRDDMLPVLTGVKLEIDGSTPVAAGHRPVPAQPARARVDARSSPTSRVSALVPARVLSDTAKSLPAGLRAEHRAGRRRVPARA